MGLLKKLKKQKIAAKQANSALEVPTTNKKRIVSSTIYNGGMRIADWNRPRIEALIHVRTSLAVMHYLIKVLHYGSKRLIRYTQAHSRLIDNINDWYSSKGTRGVSVNTLADVLEDESVFHYRPRKVDDVPPEGKDTIPDWAEVQAMNISQATLKSYEIPFIMTLYDYMEESKRTVKEFAVWLYNLKADFNNLKDWIAEVEALRRVNVNGSLEKPVVRWQREVLEHLNLDGKFEGDSLTLYDNKYEANKACRFLAEVWDYGGMSASHKKQLGLA